MDGYRACCAYDRKPEFSLDGALFSIYFVQHWVMQQFLNRQLFFPWNSKTHGQRRLQGMKIWWFPCHRWVKTIGLTCIVQNKRLSADVSPAMSTFSFKKWYLEDLFRENVAIRGPRHQMAIFSVALCHAVDKKNPIQSPQMATTPRKGGVNGTT